MPQAAPRSTTTPSDGSSKKSMTLNGVTLSTGYTYGDDDRLETLTYPSGETVTYEYDAERFLSRVVWRGGAATPATPVVLAENLVHRPFGPTASFDLGQRVDANHGVRHCLSNVPPTGGYHPHNAGVMCWTSNTALTRWAPSRPCNLGNAKALGPTSRGRQPKPLMDLT